MSIWYTDHRLPDMADTTVLDDSQTIRVPIPMRHSKVFQADIRPSDYEYLLLSQHAYNPSNALPVEMLGRWEVLCQAPITQVGYQGVLYRNKTTNALVLAHRGTDSYKLGIEDIRGVYFNLITNYQMEASTFTEIALRKLADLNWSHLSFTGHSLGGYLAQWSLFDLCRRRNGSGETAIPSLLHFNAVTFESPGVEDKLSKTQSNHLPFEVNLRSLDIVNYVTHPNPVNTFGRHIGTLYSLLVPVDPEEQKWACKKLIQFFTYLKKSHSIHRIVDYWKSDGPERRCMAEWPSFEYFPPLRTSPPGSEDLSPFQKMYEKRVEACPPLSNHSCIPLRHFHPNVQRVLRDGSFGFPDRELDFETLLSCYTLQSLPESVLYVELDRTKIEGLEPLLICAPCSGDIVGQDNVAHKFRHLLSSLLERAESQNSEWVRKWKQGRP